MHLEYKIRETTQNNAHTCGINHVFILFERYYKRIFTIKYLKPKEVDSLCNQQFKNTFGFLNCKRKWGKYSERSEVRNESCLT